MGKQKSKGHVGDLGNKRKYTQGPCHHSQPQPSLATTPLKCLVLL